MTKIPALRRIRSLLFVSTLFFGVYHFMSPSKDRRGDITTRPSYAFTLGLLVTSLLKRIWTWDWKGDEVIGKHPISRLMLDAQVKFEALMTGQSVHFQQACAEYRRRYNRDPPKGFDDWWRFTQDNNVKIIDEYDNVVRDLEPFWSLSGEELRRRAVQVGRLPSIDLVRIKDGKASTVKRKNELRNEEAGARARGFQAMIEKFQHKLPDMDFPINTKEEGRVLVPWENIQYPNTSKQNSSQWIDEILREPIDTDRRGDDSLWEAFRRTCDPGSPARRVFASIRANPNNVPINRFEKEEHLWFPSSEFTFAKAVNDNLNFCAHPLKRYHHGHFFADGRTIPALYPVFSPAKADGFSDILIPSHHYYLPTEEYTYGFIPLNRTFPQDVDDSEVPWHKKTNKIFWRGATTGGSSNPPGFVSQYQRHRFIAMSSDTSDANRTIAFRYPADSQQYTLTKVPVSELNTDIMDTAFTRAVGCIGYPGGCDGTRKALRFANDVPLGHHWRHKYLLDLDGMGHSARIFSFLMSGSAVMKATVYKEFFSDWIQPWLHYIPLSSEYSEMYNIHAYFSGASPSMRLAASKSNYTTTNPNPFTHPPNPRLLTGDAQLQMIARAGRKWRKTIGRSVDIEAYLYRLCLEYARLWSDDRDSMSYKDESLSDFLWDVNFD